MLHCWGFCKNPSSRIAHGATTFHLRHCPKRKSRAQAVITPLFPLEPEQLLGNPHMVFSSRGPACSNGLRPWPPSRGHVGLVCEILQRNTESFFPLVHQPSCELGNFIHHYAIHRTMTVLEVLPAIIHVNAQGNVFRGHVDEFLRIAEPGRGIVIPVSRKSVDHVLGSCKEGCIVLLPAFVSFVDAEAIDIVPNRFLRALGVVFLLRSCTKTEVSHREGGIGCTAQSAPPSYQPPTRGRYLISRCSSNPHRETSYNAASPFLAAQESPVQRNP